MANKILVTDVSQAGSTAGGAEAIGKTSAEDELQVDMMPISEAPDLTSYGAVVAASAIRKSRWLSEVLRWMQAQQAELSRKPFAEFTVCRTLAVPKGEQYRSPLKEWIAKEQRRDSHLDLRCL